MAANTHILSQSQRPMLPPGLATGLPNHWYPILPSSALAAAPQAIERFSEKLMVWRDGKGQPHVFENHCPHRRAPLSKGKVAGDLLVCSYHGWRFDGSGSCAGIPLEEGADLSEQRNGVKSYPAEDRAGYIWMFYGDRENMRPLTVPPELADDAWMSFRTEYVWKTNWLNIMDNIVDPLHAIFLHVGAVTQRKRAKFKEFRITHEDENGFRLGKLGYLADGSVGPVEGEVEFVLPNLLRLDIADGSDRGIYRVVILPTPINENTACAFYVRARRVANGWERLCWRWWWAWHGKQVHAVADQDREIMEGLGPVEEAREKEHLSISDAGVVRLRRRLQQAFRAGHNSAS
jgi:phenylpropionate dioxygenase-like ring-hydroxylating dioxygenase large terminal subunit